MDTDNNLEQSNIIFDELVDLIYLNNNTEKVIKKYNELSPDLKKLVLNKTIDFRDSSVFLLACEYKLSDLISNIINDCINLGIEHVLSKPSDRDETPLMILIDKKLFKLALILLKTGYSNPNYHKQIGNRVALDIVIQKLEYDENNDIYVFVNNEHVELFILLVDIYLEDDNTIEYENPARYRITISRIIQIIKDNGLKQYLSDETKSKLKFKVKPKGSNNYNYFNIRKFIPKIGINKHNSFTNIQSPSLNAYNNRDNSIQEVEATYNYIPETNATRNIVSPLAHAEVLHNEPFPYHMVYEDETPFLINTPHNNINPVVNIPINQPINQQVNLPKKPIKPNIMNSLFKISEKLNISNNTTDKPKSREELANIQADAAEKRIFLMNQEKPPTKPPKPNITVKAFPIKPPKPNVTVKALPIKPPKPNVTVKALPIKPTKPNVTIKALPAKPPKPNVTVKVPPAKPPKPTRGGSKTRKVKSQTKNKRKYNKKNKI
jgi:hypothetical protein